MQTKTKRITILSITLLLIISTSLYVSIEDYQKENLTKLLNQTFSNEKH